MEPITQTFFPELSTQSLVAEGIEAHPAFHDPSVERSLAWKAVDGLPYFWIRKSQTRPGQFVFVLRREIDGQFCENEVRPSYFRMEISGDRILCGGGQFRDVDEVANRLHQRFPFTAGLIERVDQCALDFIQRMKSLPIFIPRTVNLSPKQVQESVKTSFYYLRQNEENPLRFDLKILVSGSYFCKHTFPILSSKVALQVLENDLLREAIPINYLFEKVLENRFQGHHFSVVDPSRTIEIANQLMTPWRSKRLNIVKSSPVTFDPVLRRITIALTRRQILAMIRISDAFDGYLGKPSDRSHVFSGESTNSFLKLEDPNLMRLQVQAAAHEARLFIKGQPQFTIKRNYPKFSSSAECVEKILKGSEGIVFSGRKIDSLCLEFLTRMLFTLKKERVTTLFLEHFPYERMQTILDQYQYQPHSRKVPQLKAVLDELNVEHGEYTYQDLIETAKEMGIRVVGLETEVSELAGLVGERTDQKNIERATVFLHSAMKVIQQEKRSGKFALLVKESHTISNYNLPGLASMLKCGSLFITEDRRRFPDPITNSVDANRVFEGYQGTFDAVISMRTGKRAIPQ